jgi:transcriptional regulator with XRE-family HTH domain
VTGWAEVRARRLAEPGATAEYDAAELGFDVGAAVRRLRDERGLSQSSLAETARTTQPVVARLEAGGALPTLPVLQRIARALGLRLEIGFSSDADDDGVRQGPGLGQRGGVREEARPTEEVGILRRAGLGEEVGVRQRAGLGEEVGTRKGRVSAGRSAFGGRHEDGGQAAPLRAGEVVGGV